MHTMDVLNFTILDFSSNSLFEDSLTLMDNMQGRLTDLKYHFCVGLGNERQAACKFRPMLGDDCS